MLFSGTISAKIDAKGRVFLPSDFRKQLSDKDESLVLKHDIYQPCLVIYPRSVWCAEVDFLRTRLNQWISREAMLFRQFMAEVEQVVLDSNGRFLIPKHFLQFSAINHNVLFIGVDNRIELWSEEKYKECFFSTSEYAQAMEEISVGWV